MTEPRVLEATEAQATSRTEAAYSGGKPLRKLLLLLAITLAAVAVHGYHYGIEDDAIYLPAIKAHLDSRLYPLDAAFFLAQTRPMLFDELVAELAKVAPRQVEWVVFACYLLTLGAFFAALGTLTEKMFPERRAQLMGVLLVASLLTLPVAGTCLFLVDQHLHPRTLATALILWAAARLLGHAKIGLSDALWAVGLMALAAVVHVQMAFYGAFFLSLLVAPAKWLRQRWLQGMAVLLAALGMAVVLAVMPPGGAEWQEAARTRVQHYLLRWEWYEWLGAVAPPLLLWGMSRLAERTGSPVAAQVARRTAIFAALGLLLGMAMTIPPQLERLTPLQPMRTLHLTYILMLTLAGGLMASATAKRRWLAVSLAGMLAMTAAGMGVAQLQLFPDSQHIEWPGRAGGNDWVQAFEWVKQNTPRDAYFVLDPRYMRAAGEDYHGFRGLAERGQMADWEKDPGVVLLFPALAKRWSREVHELDGWEHFTQADLHQLHEKQGVGWTVVPVAAAAGGQILALRPPVSFPVQDCPYQNRRVAVCRVK